MTVINCTVPSQWNHSCIVCVIDSLELCAPVGPNQLTLSLSYPLSPHPKHSWHAHHTPRGRGRHQHVQVCVCIQHLSVFCSSCTHTVPETRCLDLVLTFEQKTINTTTHSGHEEFCKLCVVYVQTVCVQRPFQLKCQAFFSVKILLSTKSYKWQ